MNGNYDIDVLVVDDTAGAAQDYASLIALKTKLRVEAVEDPMDALRMLREHHVKIIVLDQKMPMIGTDVFVRAREIAPQIRAIMLSSEATYAEGGGAMRMGFSATVEKSDVLDQLVPAVTRAYAEYEETLAKTESELSDEVVYRSKGSLLPWRRGEVSYRLIGIQVVDETRIFEGQWETATSVHVGQSEQVTISKESVRELELGDESVQTLSSQFGLSSKQLADFSGQLSHEISVRRSQTTRVSKTEAQTNVKTFNLPPEPEDLNRVHVKMRRVQFAPVYEEIRAELHASCSSCGHPHLLAINVYVPTGRRAVRHEDFLSNGSRKVHLFGAE